MTIIHICPVFIPPQNKNKSQTRTWIRVIKTTYQHALVQKQTIWFNIWIKHKYNNFKLRLPFNRSSKTHWVAVWKSVHNTEPLPSYIWWNMHLLNACWLLQRFPRSLAFMETNVIMMMYRESKNNTYKRHLKLLGYCYFPHLASFVYVQVYL